MRDTGVQPETKEIITLPRFLGEERENTIIKRIWGGKRKNCRRSPQDSAGGSLKRESLRHLTALWFRRS